MGFLHECLKIKVYGNHSCMGMHYVHLDFSLHTSTPYVCIFWDFRCTCQKMILKTIYFFYSKAFLHSKHYYHITIMSLPCHYHVITMSLPCHYHVIIMSLSCQYHVIIMSLSCHFQVIITSLSCHHQVIITSSSGHHHVIITSSSCHHHVIIMSLLYLMCAFSYQKKYIISLMQ